MPDPAADARQIIDSAQYLTLATADAEGLPWASPVWFAHDRFRQFVWVSKPEARHSRNLAVRPEVAFVVFDSTVPMGHGQAVYAEAQGGDVPEDDAERLVAVFSRRSEAFEGRPWALDDITPPAGLRLYQATVSALFVLGPNDERLPVSGL